MSKNIEIRLSTAFNPKLDIITDIMEVDRVAYKGKCRFEYESLRARYLKNRDTYILAYDGLTGQLIGYFNFIPISEMLYYDMCCSDKMRGDDITPNEMTEYGFATNLHLMSVAVLPEYQNTDVIEELKNEFRAFLEEKELTMYYFLSITAYGATPSGTKFLRNLGFVEERKVRGQKSLYELKLKY